MVKACISLTRLTDVRARSKATFHVRNFSSALWIGSNGCFISCIKIMLSSHSGGGSFTGANSLKSPFMKLLIKEEAHNDGEMEFLLNLESAARCALIDEKVRPDFARESR